MDLLGDNNEKAVTGSSDRCIKVWDIGACDLVSVNTYRYAHNQAITGLSAKPTDDKHLFASCSRDRNICIWDHRVSVPVADYFEGCHVYTTITWADIDGIDRIYAGENSGNIAVHDPRSLKMVLEVLKNTSNRSVHRIKVNKNLVTVLSLSNVVEVLDSAANHSVVYTNSGAEDYVRDVHYVDDKTFYSVGWDKKFTKHVL